MFVNAKDSKYDIKATHVPWNKGKKLGPRSAETKAKIGAGHKGKVVSKETRAKLRANSTGVVLSKETRAKIGAIHKGKVVSKESIAKGKATVFKKAWDNA